MYSCCGREFLLVDKFILHMEYSHNVSSYRCAIQNCYRSFHTRSVFKKHLLSVHNFSQSTNSPTLFVSADSNDPTIQNDSIVTIIGEGSNILENIVTYETIDKSKFVNEFSSMLKESALSFITKLYNNITIPRTCVQFIVSSLETFISSVTQLILPLIASIERSLKFEDLLDMQFIRHLVLIFQNSFKDYNTDFKRFNYFLESDKLIKPQQHTMGVRNDVSTKGSKTSLVLKPLTCAYIPVQKTLKSFLELPGVLLKILSYQQTLANDKSGTSKNIIQGDLWMRSREKFKEKDTLPLLIYFDDLQVGNPLGSHATIGKIGAIYYTIPTIPPIYSSKLQNIFVAEIFHSTDRSSCSNESTFKNLLQDLQNLENFGMLITTEEGHYRIGFCVTLLIGDNLGVHSLLGLTESFSAINYCRICTGNKDKLCTQVKEDKCLLRNKHDYTNHLQNNLYGVKEYCIWNTLKYYHLYENTSCDIMHDLLEGVHRYDLARILKNLIDDKHFSLDAFNTRLQYSTYDCNEKNVIPSIKQEHLVKGYVICSASEMLNLMKNLRFIIGDFVPNDNKYWQLYLLLLEITNILIAPEIENSSIDHLAVLIERHHLMYIDLFNEHLKPKHHFMVHYPSLIRLVGPLSHLSSIRFEAKHRELKVISNNVRSRVNIPISIANRLQLQSCYRYFDKIGLKEAINIGPPNKRNVSEYDEILENHYPVQWYERNSITYKNGFVLYYADTDTIPQFAKVEEIFVHKKLSTEVLFYSNVYRTIAFEPHYKAYSVTLENKSLLISFNKLRSIYPTVEHMLGPGILIGLPKENIHI